MAGEMQVSLESEPKNLPMQQSSSDRDGNVIRNSILLELPFKEAETVLPRLEFVRLNFRHVLHETRETLKSAYFRNSGLISILSVFPNGKSVEVGLVGKEGFVGLPLIVGFRTANTRSVVQIEALAFRIDAETLAEVLPHCRMLNRRLQQLSQVVGMEMTQVAACNHLHEANQRLARWLLMCSDRMNSNSVPLTQEALSQLLGTRRSTVTLAAGMLETSGLILKSRKKIEILDRTKLEKAACDCYAMMRSQETRWRDDSN